MSVWNRWRAENLNVQIDLSSADLSNLNLSYANLSQANLYDANINNTKLHFASFANANLRDADISYSDLSMANLNGSNLSDSYLCNSYLGAAKLSNAVLDRADLSDTDLGNAVLTNANLKFTTLNRAKLHFTNLSSANLCHADLSGSDLSTTNFRRADLSGSSLFSADLYSSCFNHANLSGANLNASRSLHTSFVKAKLTGACIADWHIGPSTKLDDVICEYVYRARDKDGRFSARLPVDSSSIFASGEFVLWTRIRASALETIDLTFTESIDWQDFFKSIQEVRSQNPDTGIFLQGVEERNCQYVVRLRIETDKTGDDRIMLESKIETATKELIQAKRQLHEAHGEIKALDRSLEKALRMATDQGPKYDLKGAQFAGGFAETVQGNQIGGVINNYGQKAEDIVRLLSSLHEQAQTFPTEHKEEALDLLNDIEIDLKKPEPNINRMGRKLKRFAEIATTIGILTAGAVTFSGNLNEVVGNVIELTEILGIPIDQVQPSQISPEDTTQ